VRLVNRRAIRMETTHLEMHCIQTQAEAVVAGSSTTTDTGRFRDYFVLTLSFLRDPTALKLIGQYESRLSRDFARTLSQLRQAQKLRSQSNGMNVQESREQTQPDPPTTPETSTTVARASASSGASASPQEMPAAQNTNEADKNSAQQTQSAPNLMETVTLFTTASS
jgi:hypothetical protein